MKLSKNQSQACRKCGHDPKAFDWSLQRGPAWERRLRAAKAGVEVQEIAWDPTMRVVCAGVHWVPEMGAKWAWKLARHWHRWLRWMERQRRLGRLGRQPAVPAQPVPVVAWWTFHPIDDPQTRRSWAMPAEVRS